MRRKFLSVVLCVCMMLTMAPFAFAAGTDTGSNTEGAGTSTPANSSSGAGGSAGSVSTSTTNAITNETNLITALESANDGDTITISGTISINTPLVITKTVTLTGGSITASDSFTANSNKLADMSLISLKSAGKVLTLKDITLDANHKTLVVFSNAGKVVVDDAIITGGKTNSYVAGVYMTNASEFEMTSGSIRSNEVGKTDYSKYAADLWVGANAKATLSGGNIDNIFVNANSFSENNPGYFKMQDGHVTNLYAEYYKNYGATVIYDGGTIDNLYISTTASNGACKNVTPVAGMTYKGGQTDEAALTPVAEIDAKKFTSLADAIATADNKTVILLKDVTEDVVIPSDKTVTLNLNGKKLTNASSDTITVASGANLTITGEGTVDNVTHGKADIYNNGTVILNGGNYTRSQEAENTTETSGGNSYYNILNHGDMTIDGAVKVLSTGHFSSLVANGYYSYSSTNPRDGYVSGTNQDKPNLTIKGGSFSGGINTIKNDDAAILTINGGTFTNYTQAALQNHGTATVTAGSFTANSKYAIDNCGCDATNDPGKLEISGGTFNGTLYIRSAYSNVTISDGYFNGSISKTGGDITITGGYFTSDPSAYVASGHYTVDSSEDGYSYMVTTQQPSAAPVIVEDKTETANSIENENVKNSVDAVINNANVDGVAEAVNKDSILTAASVPDSDKANKDAKIVIDVQVNVKATGATTTTTTDGSESISTLTFSASPQATVKKVTVSDSFNYNEGKPIDLPNSYLNGKEITVKLPLPANFTPKQIKHTCSDNNVEYFLNHYERGAKMFTVDNNHCAVFTITKFSTFEVSGTQTYVEPSSGGSISTPTTYAVNVNAATNGAVAADKKTASKGTTVTVTASPSKGYVVDAVKVVDKDGKDVAVTEKDGKYVFTMPASAVTVTGSFKAETPAPVALPFTDVKSGNWFYDAVQYAYAQGLMTGTSATTFAPNGTMNRAMIVTVLYRLEKSPAVTGASKFTDVPAGQWYSDAVAWAAANKIVNGYDETTFGPMNAVTREQMAAILFRYEQVKGLENVTLEENLNRFPDQNKISAYAIPALQWAVGQKIINGNADGTLDPTGTATRAQVAQIFTNLLNK